MMLFLEGQFLVSFDFDDTLFMRPEGNPIWANIELLFNESKAGQRIIVVTARDSSESPWVETLLSQFALPVEKVYYTSNQLKGPLLKELGVQIHYDDSGHQLQSAIEHGIKAIDSRISGI